MGSSALGRVGSGSTKARQGQSEMALPSGLDISSVLPFYFYSGAHLSWHLFLLPEVKSHWWERQGKEGVHGTTSGSLRLMSSSVQQCFCSKVGTKPDVALPKGRHKDNRFDTSEIQHGLFCSSCCLRFLYCGLQKLL